MSTILGRLYDRATAIQSKTGRPPKRLSIGVAEYPALMSESTANVVLFSMSRRGRHFMGIPLRLRNYARERAKKWHGQGAILTELEHDRAP